MRKLVVSAVIAVLASTPVFAQSADDGEKIFKKCKACHQVGADAKNRTGPILTGVVGRDAGSVADFSYSKSMRAAGEAGLVWTAENIATYISDPSKFLREFLDDPKAKAKMSFKLKKEQERLDVVAYLATFQTTSMAPADGFCVVNASAKPHLFATETREGARQLQELAPGASLCASGSAASDGIVSVFEDADGFEGCSRIVAIGKSEALTEYAEFDRCGWGSHNL